MKKQELITIGMNKEILAKGKNQMIITIKILNKSKDQNLIVPTIDGKLIIEGEKHHLDL